MARLGGLHRFMRWERPILTDSGGFQVMSLGKISKVKEEGVTFASHIDGTKYALTPSARSRSRPTSWAPTSSCSWTSASPGRPRRLARARRWSCRRAGRSAARRRSASAPTQALFGIQQGSTFPHLRRESAERLTEMGFDGYALGGLAVGEGHDAMVEVLDYAPALLPADRPRYLMGVGKPLDLVEAVARGVDMFDCVLPTRSGRHGQAWTWDGPVNLKNARFAEDDEPLDPETPCPASRDYSKAYLHHLFKAEEILGQVLLSWHNVAFFEALTAAMREAIAQGRFEAFRREFRARQPQGAEPG